MPLRDHFEPPLKTDRPWESCYSIWLSTITEALNVVLPKDYCALPETHAGASIQIDVATFGNAVLPEVYAPPLPSMSIRSAFADDFEIKVIRESGGLKLVAAIGLVRPANKDRPESRTAFATKCASYLHNGVAVIVVDVVTERSANLHDEIVPLVTTNVVPPMGEGLLYAVAYRPILRKERAEIDVWPHRLTIGEALPVLPLWLNAVLAVPVDLESTYATALRRARIE